MNWFKFLLWIAGIYTSYYLGIMLKDVKGCRGSPANTLTEDAPDLAQSLDYNLQGCVKPDCAVKSEKIVEIPVKLNSDRPATP